MGEDSTSALQVDVFVLPFASGLELTPPSFREFVELRPPIEFSFVHEAFLNERIEIRVQSPVVNLALIYCQPEFLTLWSNRYRCDEEREQDSRSDERSNPRATRGRDRSEGDQTSHHRTRVSRRISPRRVAGLPKKSNPVVATRRLCVWRSRLKLVAVFPVQFLANRIVSELRHGPLQLMSWSARSTETHTCKLIGCCRAMPARTRAP